MEIHRSGGEDQFPVRGKDIYYTEDEVGREV